MSDKKFREEAKRAFLTEDEASSILRIRVLDRLWRERTFDKDAMILDRFALSHAVENHRRENARRRNAALSLMLDFLAKLRFW